MVKTKTLKNVVKECRYIKLYTHKYLIDTQLNDEQNAAAPQGSAYKDINGYLWYTNDINRGWIRCLGLISYGTNKSDELIFLSQ